MAAPSLGGGSGDSPPPGDAGSGAAAAARVWVSDGPRYRFPEHDPALARLPPAGVCFSGGGTRSLAATAGQLRGLTATGLIADVGYLACVSGGAWAAVPYTFHAAGARDDEELLGPVLPPEAVSQRSLAALPEGRLDHPATGGFEQHLAAANRRWRPAARPGVDARGGGGVPGAVRALRPRGSRVVHFGCRHRGRDHRRQPPPGGYGRPCRPPPRVAAAPGDQRLPDLAGRVAGVARRAAAGGIRVHPARGRHAVPVDAAGAVRRELHGRRGIPGTVRVRVSGSRERPRPGRPGPRHSAAPPVHARRRDGGDERERGAGGGCSVRAASAALAGRRAGVGNPPTPIPSPTAATWRTSG